MQLTWVWGRDQKCVHFGEEGVWEPWNHLSEIDLNWGVLLKLGIKMWPVWKCLRIYLLTRY